MKMLTSDRTRELLEYDEETGIFRWRVHVGQRGCVGSEAGGLDRKGYVRIQIERKRYFAHRLAWLYVTSAWPADQIDHINGQRADNRIANLREATPSENQCNQRHARSNNKIGLLGVSRNRKGFKARIKVEGNDRYLGTFPTTTKAHTAYIEAKRRLHARCEL